MISFNTKSGLFANIGYKRDTTMNNAFNRDEQATTPRAKIIAGVERLSTLFRANLQNQAKKHGLSPLQTQIILFVCDHEKSLCNTSFLASEFAVTKPTVSDAVRVLVEKKLLIKKQDAKDARAFSLQLSASGKRLHQKLHELSENLYEKLDAFNSATDEEVWAALYKLIKALQSNNEIPSRMCHSCEHFADKHPEGKPHYCLLMEDALTLQDLRLDCPEHTLSS
jgi:DNA-binding MarR family transcriptional regulator